jgi:hypothetical protein
MLLHLIHISPHTCSCIQVGSELELKNRVHEGIYQYILHIIDSNLISQYHKIKIHHIGITYMTIVMLGRSYGSKIYEEQERNRSSYCQKPIVQRWNTPPSSWWWCRRRWRRWRFLQRLMEFPPPIFVGSTPVLVFQCFCDAPLEETLKVIYTGVLGQKKSVGKGIRRNGRPWSKRAS